MEQYSSMFVLYTGFLQGETQAFSKCLVLQTVQAQG